MSDDKAVVEGFLAALEALDLDAAEAFLAPECVYQNVPLPPDRSREATMRTLRNFMRLLDRFEVEMVHIVAEGGVVLTERVDTLAGRGYYTALPVCGTFEVRDGKITLWRDSFDWARLTFDTLRSLPRMLVHPLTG